MTLDRPDVNLLFKSFQIRKWFELVDHFKIYEGGNSSVKFKFADELRRIAEYVEINTKAAAV